MVWSWYVSQNTRFSQPQGYRSSFSDGLQTLQSQRCFHGLEG